MGSQNERHVVPQGGEVVTYGRDGKIRDPDTIAPGLRSPGIEKKGGYSGSRPLSVRVS